MHWITDALCAEVGPTLFYAEPNDNMMTVAAKQVCNVCPVIDTCAEHGIKHEVHGVWGGLSPNERRLIRRERGIDVQTLVLPMQGVL